MFLQKLKQVLAKPVFKFKINYNPLKWNGHKIKEFLKIFLLTALIILVFLTISLVNDPSSLDDELATDVGSGDEQAPATDCNVQGIELHGDLVTYISLSDYDVDGNVMVDQTASENVVLTIEGAEKDDQIKAIILEIDSYGGLPVAAEEISAALKNAKKPTVALIRGAADSAAYWSAIGANRIFASKNSDVGSIGVTMSYVDNSRQNQTEGLTYNQLSSGKFKDAGSSDKVLSAEEKKLFMRDINILNQNFIKTVAENRKLDLQKVAALADGSTMLGEMALQNGLIDQIGGMAEVKKYLKEKIGAAAEVCW